MKGCLRSTGSRKGALDLAKKGMLQKDNLFEVVRYPGADKRGHLWSGQVFLIWKDTGGAVQSVYPRKGGCQRLGTLSCLRAFVPVLLDQRVAIDPC